MAEIKTKEVKSGGAIQIKMDALRAYIEKNRKRVFAGTGIFFALIIIIVGWYLYKLDYEKNAQKLYAEAFSFYHLSQPGEETSSLAVKMYSEVIKKYPGSRAATNANFSMGNIYFRKGDFDRAIQSYRDALESSGLRDELKSLANSGLGYCYEAKGDIDRALEFFEKSIKGAPGSAVLSSVYRSMAGIYLEKKERAKALDYYRKAGELKNDPVMDAMIKRKIAELEA